ncbi:sulfite exporter TauE/SafE family protein [Ammoniphilus resinae]|uniref:Probable membrane transporter protein n=1 Tax=Ammoniphilus resinae TaxID=861532 RepID=A0ABS4GLX5_9BACL|nr:sulfite exporter TauE/SafE family protein [Ammoniphilus resinae]MBP1931268.1 putative membrane protein YfcA [Ammoniphilus resinae]
MSIFTVMFAMGTILGFVGAGGSGFIIAILITFFHIPVHTALATAMAAMFLTMISGTISHYREGNVDLRVGLTTGLFGALGAYVGTGIAHLIPASQLIWLTASMLVLSSCLIWLRTRSARFSKQISVENSTPVPLFLIKAVGIGIVTGLMSGTFGIGSTPFIQLALLLFMGSSLQKVSGTTMMIILPIALFGAIGYNQAGYLDIPLLIKVVCGTMIGSYIGAKFTNIAPTFVLRFAMITTPLLSGLLLLGS